MLEPGGNAFGRKSPPFFLGINPWIYDFAAYNLWMRPVGLLTCLGMLRRTGAVTALMDCLERREGDVSYPVPKANGRGHFPKTILPKPAALKDIPRNYRRYGRGFQEVRQALSSMARKPDAILVTSIMTYWYPGVVAAICLAREVFPGVPVVLGGIYATLCRDHALKLGMADLVISGPLESGDNWRTFWEFLGETPPALPADACFAMCTDYYEKPDYAPLLTSRGCPYRCGYCAGKLLHPEFRQVSDADVLYGAFMSEYVKGVRDFCFFDDALLIDAKKRILPFLERVIESGRMVRFHTPNATHVRNLSPELCVAMKMAGFEEIGISLETLNFGNRFDVKLTEEEWTRGVRLLLEAGFDSGRIEVHFLSGLPGQGADEPVKVLEMVNKFGLKPILNEYGPIPGTEIFPKALAVSPYPLEEEPLFHNNSLNPCRRGGFFDKDARRVRNLLHKQGADP